MSAEVGGVHPKDVATALRNPSKMKKATRRRLTKWGLVIGNLMLLLIVSAFVLSNRSASQTVRTSNLSSVSSTASALASPLDQLSSAQIALTAAQITQVPELTAIKNQADSDAILINTVPNDTVSLAKPQIVATALKSKADIRHYTTVSGDTLSGLAAKFGVTSNSIKWSNNLYGDYIAVGTKLVIPPVNGIVYTVKSGDTPSSLAAKFQADAGQIISYNDAEINGLKPGDQIIIPNGEQPVSTFYGYYSGFAWGNSAIYGYNGYDYGYCTWYVANRRAALGNPVPSNLGNAYSWYRGALNAGLPTGSTPKVGAVLINTYGDHVSVVEQVNADGSFWVSEMNSYGQVAIGNSTPTGGWGRVDYKLISAAAGQNYKYLY